MVQNLIDALLSLIASSTANVGDNSEDDEQTPTENLFLIMIGQTLSTAAAVSPDQANRRRNIFAHLRLTSSHHPGSLPLITQSPLRLSAVTTSVIDNLTAATSMLLSPPRRRIRGGNIVRHSTSTAIVASSPRQGQDSKQAKATRPPGVTDSLGWGRCTIEEFANFSVDDELILVIPSDNRKKDSKYAMAQRQLLRDRLICVVGVLIHNCNHAPQYVSKYHGIDRNNNEYIKIWCSNWYVRAVGYFLNFNEFCLKGFLDSGVSQRQSFP